MVEIWNGHNRKKFTVVEVPVLSLLSKEGNTRRDERIELY